MIMKIAYLGIEGSNSFIAAKKYFDQKNMFIPFSSIADVLSAVRENTCDAAVVPIENSTTGSINDTYDGLMEGNNMISITGEVIVKIHHHLVAIRSKLKAYDLLQTITDCYSHQQASAQSRIFLKQFPNIQLHFTSDTATAAQKIALLKNIHACAISNSEAAKLYGLDILKEKIEDTSQNFTRFVIIGKKINTKGNKVSIAYSVAHIPGSLYESLKPFAKLGINLTKIESRPLYLKRWEYIFFVDFELNGKIYRFKKALSQLKDVTNFITILGYYNKGKVYET